MKLSEKKIENIEVDLLVCFVDQPGDGEGPRLPDMVASLAAPALAAGDFNAKAGQTLLLYPGMAGQSDSQPAAKRILLVGLGEPAKDEDAEREALRLAAGTVVGRGRALKAGTLLAVMPEVAHLADDEAAAALAEGLVLANYQFRKYKTEANEDDPAPIATFLLHPGGHKVKKSRQGMERGLRAALAACAARNMANEPGNHWTPEAFARYGRRLAEDQDLDCTVLDRTDMEKLGMGGILGVNQGSDVEPLLVIVEYRAGKDRPTLMLVGKGLTFDSGGISLKPAAGMEEMKYDMCGGAAVLTAMCAIALERPEHINVIALVPTTDNMSGSRAMRPGDVIRHYGGKTSEVVNTDAEGRLILADALAYGIETFAPDAVVDLATLTGAVIIGLGHHHTGLLSNDDELAARVLAAGMRSGEPLWRLPLGPEYSKQLKSEIADLKNVGGKSGGTITAACYLQEFVGDTPWAHLDIAGTAWEFTEKSYVPSGPSGIGVRTLVELVRAWRPMPEKEPEQGE